MLTLLEIQSHIDKLHAAVPLELPAPFLYARLLVAIGRSAISDTDSQERTRLIQSLSDKDCEGCRVEYQLELAEMNRMVHQWQSMRQSLTDRDAADEQSERDFEDVVDDDEVFDDVEDDSFVEADASANVIYGRHQLHLFTQGLVEVESAAEAPEEVKPQIDELDETLQSPASLYELSKAAHLPLLENLRSDFPNATNLPWWLNGSIEKVAQESFEAEEVACRGMAQLLSRRVHPLIWKEDALACPSLPNLRLTYEEATRELRVHDLDEYPDFRFLNLVEVTSIGSEAALQPMTWDGTSPFVDPDQERRIGSVVRTLFRIGC